jgi:hydroxyethylthiazole kinase-like uncharacterized protein yjeF
MGDYVVSATRTVTFVRRKPGHLLMPGRARCGPVAVADIGIPTEVLGEIEGCGHADDPGLWRHELPRLGGDGHKYHRGHAVVVSGPMHATGAARLAARAALRVGAGLVTVASPLDAVAINASHLTSIMVAPFAASDGLGPLLADQRLSSWLIGPAAGVGQVTRERVRQLLASDAAVVLDADALTSFAAEADREALFGLTRSRASEVVLTPHEGEFRRLFPAFADAASKVEAARSAAVLSGAVVVLKGADTVIAHPGGDYAINDNAPPSLATAGSGDVLAGLITGLLAQKMPVWEAACAAVWQHGHAADIVLAQGGGGGAPLLAADLIAAIAASA